MTSKPWMPLYVADYRADTAHLSAAEHGAYLLLIMHYWQTGSLPIDDEPLARIACMKPAEWRKARLTIAAFFTAEWKHKRIDAELAKATEISSKRRASAQQRHSKSDANAEQVHTHAGATSPSQSQQKDGADAPPIDPDADLFRRGVEVLGPSGRSLVARLKKAKGGSIPHTRAAIEQASTKADPREYIGRIVNGAAESENSFRDNPTGGSLI